MRSDNLEKATDRRSFAVGASFRAHDKPIKGAEEREDSKNGETRF